MKSTALQFGLLILAFYALLQLTKYSLFTYRLADELSTVLFALLFLGVGVYLYRRFGPVKTVEVPGETIAKADPLDPALREVQRKKWGISKREYEVLQLIANGLSNQQIAAQLFISESTVKSHVSNLLLKLEAKRRTQAVSKAQQVGLL